MKILKSGGMRSENSLKYFGDIKKWKSDLKPTTLLLMNSEKSQINKENRPQIKCGVLGNRFTNTKQSFDICSWLQNP